MVSKSNFQQQNDFGSGRGDMQQCTNQSLRAAIAPYRKPYKPPLDVALMYTSCQMPTDPLYIDFNKPAPPAPPKIKGSLSAAGGVDGLNGDLQQRKKLVPKNVKQKNKSHLPQQLTGGSSGNWQKNRNIGIDNRFSGLQRFSIGFNSAPIMGGGVPMISRGGRPILPPLGPLGPRSGPMASAHSALGFQPPPIRGPIPRMNVVPPPPPSHFLRGRNGRLLHPPPMPPMMGPRMPPLGHPPKVTFNVGAPGLINGVVGVGAGCNINNNIVNSGKIRKPNAKLVKQVIKGKSTIKTLKNLVNQYPIDKPWVTTEIRAEHDKKVDIENRLKGHKDDELFAQFKIQRDKFVAIYEAARNEYLKQEAASVMAKDAKNKQTQTNAKPKAKAGVSTDATSNKIENENINQNQKPNQNKITNENTNDSNNHVDNNDKTTNIIKSNNGT